MKVLCITNMYPSVANPQSGTFVEQQIKGIENCGVSVEVLLLDRATIGMGVYKNGAALVREALQNYNPDVVHTMYGGLMGWLVSRVATACPIVQSFCGTDLQGTDVGGVGLRMRVSLGVFLSKRTLRRVEQVIVKSRLMKSKLPEWYEENRISIIPNGVSSDRFHPMDRGDCQRQLNWDPGVFHVVMAAHGYHDANKRVWLARESIELMNKNMPAQIHIISGVPHMEMPVWLNAADAVIMTSLKEGSPNIIKEALACNRPIVSVKVGDVEERIGGIDGCYIAEARPEDLAAVLVKVSHGSGEVVAQDRMQELSLERVAERVVSVYEKAIARSRE